MCKCKEIRMDRVFLGVPTHKSWTFLSFASALPPSLPHQKGVASKRRPPSAKTNRLREDEADDEAQMLRRRAPPRRGLRTNGQAGRRRACQVQGAPRGDGAPDGGRPRAGVRGARAAVPRVLPAPVVVAEDQECFPQAQGGTCADEPRRRRRSEGCEDGPLPEEFPVPGLLLISISSFYIFM
jgi:hypothetical protein